MVCSEKQKKEQSIRCTGIGNSFFGKKHSKDSVDKMVESRHKISLKKAKRLKIM